MTLKATCLALALVTAVAPVYAKAPSGPEYQQARKDMQAAQMEAAPRPQRRTATPIRSIAMSNTSD